MRYAFFILLASICTLFSKDLNTYEEGPDSANIIMLHSLVTSGDLYYSSENDLLVFDEMGRCMRLESHKLYAKEDLEAKLKSKKLSTLPKVENKYTNLHYFGVSQFVLPVTPFDSSIVVGYNSIFQWQSSSDLSEFVIIDGDHEVILRTVITNNKNELNLKNQPIRLEDGKSYHWRVFAPNRESTDWISFMFLEE